MAVPKRKKSRSRTRSRKAQWAKKGGSPTLVSISLEGRTIQVPHALVHAYRRGLIEPPDAR